MTKLAEELKQMREIHKQHAAMLETHHRALYGDEQNEHPGMVSDVRELVKLKNKFLWTIGIITALGTAFGFSFHRIIEFFIKVYGQ